MNHSSEQGANRRRFIAASGLAFATNLLTHRELSASIYNESDWERFSLLSDTHIPTDKDESYRGFRPYSNLERALQRMAEAPSDAAFLCGDAARTQGLEGDYRNLSDLLRQHQAPPTKIALGNHDDRDQFRKVFAEDALSSHLAHKHVTIVNTKHVRWIILDSLLYVDRVAGLLGKAQRSWLSDYLANHDDQPTLLMVHHTLGDEDGELLDAAFLKDLAIQHDQVQAIFYGHSHRFDIAREGRVHMVNLPAIAYNFQDSQPIGWMSAHTTERSMTLVLHTLGGEQEQNGRSFELSFA